MCVTSLSKKTSISAYLQQSTSFGSRSKDVHDDDDATQASLRVGRVRYSSLSTASATPFIQPHWSRTSEWHPRDHEFIRPLHSVRSSTLSLSLVPSSGFLVLSHSLSTVLLHYKLIMLLIAALMYDHTAGRQQPKGLGPHPCVS